MKTSPRSIPASTSSWSSSLPAAPTNGRPLLSSRAPGASPTRTTSARGLPSPGTKFVHVRHGSWSHGRCPRTSPAIASRSCAGSSATHGLLVEDLPEALRRLRGVGPAVVVEHHAHLLGLLRESLGACSQLLELVVGVPVGEALGDGLAGRVALGVAPVRADVGEVVAGDG